MMTGAEILEVLSTNIKKYRKEKCWTQEKLAEESELSVQAVNFFEGKRRWPGIISRKSGQKIPKIANLQYYKSKANYGTKKKGISR